MAATLLNDWWVSPEWSDIGPSSGSLSTKQKHNADKIYSVVHALGWTDNAIAAMLGNMQIESGIDPGCSYPKIGTTFATIDNAHATNYPDNAYGLLQWKGRGSVDPSNNQLVGYAIRYNTEWYEGDIQMQRLTWEFQEPAKFHPQTVDGIYWTFSSFATSHATPTKLAKVWMICYEGTWSKLSTRQSNAESWYDYIHSSPGPEPPEPPEPPPIPDDWIWGPDFARLALAYDPDITGVQIPYSTWDCIAFVNAVWQDIDIVRDNGWSLPNGTNSFWRSTTTFNTQNPLTLLTPTPILYEKDTLANIYSHYGQLPAGMLLFHQISEAGPPPIPPQYAGDGIGNFVHVGIYCGNNIVMQSGGRDSGDIPGGGVHRSVFDPEAWNYGAFVCWVDCSDIFEPEEIPQWFYMWYTQKRKEVNRFVKRKF